MDGDPMAGALLTAFNALIEVAPPGRIVPVLRHALVELLDDPPIPTTIGERPRPSRQRGVSQPGLETWIPLRDRVLAELAARGMSRRQLAKELRIAPGTVKSMLLPRCRAHGPANNARIRKWLERRPTPVPSKGDAASQHNGDATTSDTPTKPTALPPYRCRFRPFADSDRTAGVDPTRPFAGVALSSKSADENSDDPLHRSAPDQRHAALKNYERKLDP